MSVGRFLFTYYSSAYFVLTDCVVMARAGLAPVVHLSRTCEIVCWIGTESLAPMVHVSASPGLSSPDQQCAMVASSCSRLIKKPAKPRRGLERRSVLSKGHRGFFNAEPLFVELTISLNDVGANYS